VRRQSGAAESTFSAGG